MKKLKISGPIVTSFLLLLCALECAAQQLPSHVYNWTDLKTEEKPTGIVRPVLEGATADLEYFEIHVSTVPPGEALHAAHSHADKDELVIVKDGFLKVTLGSTTKVIGQGGVLWASAGEMHGFQNGGPTPVTYYVLNFRSKLPVQLERGTKAGGSFTLDWKDVAVAKTEKGERRNFFDRPTAMFERFEMHVTTLNKGQISHAPHTHAAEEMIVLIKGNAEMTIGDTNPTASPGALIFLASQIPHALKNVGDGPCEYFAFQWQSKK
jgi:(S)-ureidoglycine aminohydrolase